MKLSRECVKSGVKQIRVHDLRHSHVAYGRLNEHLHEIDTQCYEREELLVEQMKAGAGITEELKAADQMKWVGLMNNVRSSAEEIVLKEMIYV